MSNQTEDTHISLDAADCETISITLHALARNEQNLFGLIDRKFTEISHVECSYGSWLRATEKGEEHAAFALSVAEWRKIATGLAYISRKLSAGPDIEYTIRLSDLSGKASGVAGWCAGVRDAMRGAEQAKDSLPQAQPEEAGEDE